MSISLPRLHRYSGETPSWVVRSSRLQGTLSLIHRSWSDRLSDILDAGKSRDLVAGFAEALAL